MLKQYSRLFKAETSTTEKV